MTIRRALFISLALAATTSFAQFTILHSFNGGTTDGQSPYGSLVLDGSNLYGMTQLGGTGAGSGNGVLFRIGTDGANYTNLHYFAGGATDGRFPQGSLTLAGNTLYGLAANGGSADDGVVFRSATDGTSHTNLQSFTYSNGENPYGRLTIAGDTMYGMALSGGSVAGGVIFKQNTNGSSFAVIHNFSVSVATDGTYPYGFVTHLGGQLYGMTYQGGSANLGVLFRVATDGSGYTNLYSFAGSVADGSRPRGSLTLSSNGTQFYGMTSEGGVSNRGVLFRINLDGSGYTNLHNFIGGITDGRAPYYSSLIQSSNGLTLYGMTQYGGSGDRGVLFQMNSDGSGYTNLHIFNTGTTNGIYPYDSLLLSADEQTLYGMTRDGGANNRGTVFAFAIPEPSTFITVGLGLLLCLSRFRRR
jgi:uncharacterized repeat protein (TIGR03803 family)